MKTKNLLAVLIVCSWILSACGSAQNQTMPTATISLPTISPATNTAAPTSTQVPPTATNTPFVPKATFKIAIHLPLTGNDSQAGTDMLNAVKLALLQLSNPLELLGYAVELVPYDDQSDLDIAVRNAMNLVTDEGILCGVGHYYSKITIQATEVYHRAGLAFISPSSTNPYVTTRGYLEVDRVVGRNDVQGTAAAQFARERGFKSIYLIYNPQNPYTLLNGTYFNHDASLYGLNVAGLLSTNVSSGFGDVINSILKVNADLVFFAGLNNQVGNFTVEARKLGYTGTILGMDGTPELVNIAGLFALDGGGLYYTSEVPTLASLPNATQFVQDFQTRYGSLPLPFSAFAYDAAGICMKAIEEASKARGGGIPTRAEVATAIRALVDYPGITGTFNFTADGDPTLSKYQVIQVTSIDPDKWNDNPVVATYEIAPPSK